MGYENQVFFGFFDQSKKPLGFFDGQKNHQKNLVFIPHQKNLGFLMNIQVTNELFFTLTTYSKLRIR